MSDNLLKRYGDVAAVDGISFEVGEGNFFGFLGPNGASKTTTMRILASGKRITPPIYLDEERGFQELEDILREHGSAVIFCACSYATREMSLYRCHRFFVADEMASRIPDLEVIHLEEN